MKNHVRAFLDKQYAGFTVQRSLRAPEPKPAEIDWPGRWRESLARRPAQTRLERLMRKGIAEDMRG
jgi:hypothetical protein